MGEHDNPTYCVATAEGVDVEEGQGLVILEELEAWDFSYRCLKRKSSMLVGRSMESSEARLQVRGFGQAARYEDGN